jgi:hypothetical protein
MNKDFVIVIQGPIKLEYKVIENKWEGFDLIWSTWENELIDSKYPTILNKPPNKPGIKNVYYQQKSTLAGLLKAKELGYSKCLKWRSDQYPTNANKLISLFDKDKINVLFWHNSQKGYYVDYFMYGDINKMISIWDFEINSYISYPEEIITNQIYKNKIDVMCIGDRLTNQNNIIWEREGVKIDLSTYKYDKNFMLMKI